MRSAIRVCADWEIEHDRPVYTLAEQCPECGARTDNSAPAPFDPTDAHGRHRRALKRRSR